MPAKTAPRSRPAPRYYGPAGPLGCHVVDAGGLEKTPEKARALGATAMQIFTRSPRMWRASPIPPDRAAKFAAARERHGIVAAVAHAIYLLNFASARDDLWRRSIDVFSDDIERCARLGIDRLVLHPGAGGDAPVAKRRRRVLDALKEVVRRTAGVKVTILLETTAGGRGTVGSDLADMAWLLDHHPRPERLGVCLDSCHLFAAGWPLHEPDGLARLTDEIERTVGLAKIGCWHANDSLGDWNSHRDRHARVGKGKIGKDFFARLLHEPRFFGVPKILEVPGGDKSFAGDLRLLAKLAK
jgi:deoxyribonuclease-4